MSATPGPWYAEPERASDRREVAQLTNFDGALLRTWRIVHDGAEEGDPEADALLIAASTELLDACRKVVASADVVNAYIKRKGLPLREPPEIVAVRAAIEKAESGS